MDIGGEFRPSWGPWPRPWPCSKPSITMPIRNTSLGHADIFGVQLNPNKPTPELQRDNSRCAGAKEWVEHNARPKPSTTPAVGVVGDEVGSRDTLFDARLTALGQLWSRARKPITLVDLAKFVLPEQLRVVFSRSMDWSSCGAASCANKLRTTRSNRRFDQLLRVGREVRARERLGWNGPDTSLVSAQRMKAVAANPLQDRKGTPPRPR